MIDKEVLRHVLAETFFDMDVSMVGHWEHKLDATITMLEKNDKIEKECEELQEEQDEIDTEFRRRSDEILNRLHALQLQCYHFSQYIDNTRHGTPAVCHTCGKVLNGN